MNIITITLDVTCLIFGAFLTIIYFTKKNMSNIENKIYKYLLTFCLLSTIFDFLMWFWAYYFYTYKEILIVISRIYYLLLLSWFSYFVYYIIVITSQKAKKYLETINNDKILLYCFLFSLVCWIVSLFFPFYFEYYDNGIAHYQTGPAYTIYNIWLYAEVAIMILFIIINRKNVEKKKLLPVFAGIGIGIVATIGVIFLPGLCVMNLITTLICYLMYHTIENPDMKLVTKLELALEQAEKASRAKTDFLSSMSHEIRTPLNAIVGFSECIDSAETLEEAKEDSKDIILASHSLLEIVNGILDINKIEADKMDIIETSYNPLELFDSLKKLINIKIGERPIELRTNFSSQIPEILYGDNNKIKQIITNLLTNAEKYTEKGYIDFTVNCINESETCKLQIIVSDTGRGIKEEQINTLFTKFNRLEEDRNTAIEGTGLGLAITKSLVEMMGGRIAVESEYGKGSKFTVFIIQKLAHKDFEEYNKLEKQENMNFEGKKVLIVDDNKLNLKVAAKLLRDYNFDIECVESGYECIEKVQNTTYDMIFMDIMMPKMDGVETLNKLKELNNFNTPVIALTADAMQGTHDKYIEVGFDDYLSKPIDRNLLKKALNKFFNDKNISQTNYIEQKHLNENNQISTDNLQSSSVNNESQVIDNKKRNIQYLKENNVDVDASLELLGDMEMYNETLQTFIEENKARIPRIEKNKQEGNMKDYSVDAHALKSDCKYLGFKTLAELAYNHEMKSKENDINYVNEHYNELINEYNRIKSIIDKYL